MQKQSKSTGAVKTAIFSQRVGTAKRLYNAPIIEGWLAQLRPHFEVRLPGKYRSGGTRLFATIKTQKKPLADASGNIVLHAGENYLQPHIHGNNLKNYLRVLEKARAFVSGNKSFFESAGVRGIVVQVGTQELARIVQRFGATELPLPKTEKILAKPALVLMSTITPDRVPKPSSKKWEIKRYYIPLENL